VSCKDGYRLYSPALGINSLEAHCELYFQRRS